MSEQCEFGKCEECPSIRTILIASEELSQQGSYIAEEALGLDTEDRIHHVQDVNDLDAYSDSARSLAGKFMESCEDGPLTMAKQTADGRTIMVTVCSSPLIPTGKITHNADVTSFEPGIIIRV